MKRQITFVALLLFFIHFSAFAQDSGSNGTTTEETYQPNLRGSLLFGLGFNFLSNAPRDFEISPLRSKSVNIYYLYEVPLGNSRFSFNPGFGLGLEKYQFEENTILTYEDEVEGIPSTTGPVLVMGTVAEALGTTPYDVSKNRLAANYFDVPLEFSFASNRTNPKAGLKLALGGKVGYLFSAHTKIKYMATADDTRKEKLKQDWGLNRLRYGAHARIGYGSFNLYFEYQLSPLFDNQFDGPLHRTGEDTANPDEYSLFPDVTNFRAGFSFDLF